MKKRYCFSFFCSLYIFFGSHTVLWSQHYLIEQCKENFAYAKAGILCLLGLHDRKKASSEIQKMYEITLKACNLNPKKITICCMPQSLVHALPNVAAIADDYHNIIYVNEEAFNKSHYTSNLATSYHEAHHLRYHHIKKRLLTILPLAYACSCLSHKITDWLWSIGSKGCRDDGDSFFQSCTALALYTPLLYILFKWYAKSQEMEAELGAINALCENHKEFIARDILSGFLNNKIGEDDFHPSNEEHARYINGFMQEKLPGNKPSVARYGWSYFFEQLCFKIMNMR